MVLNYYLRKYSEKILSNYTKVWLRLSRRGHLNNLGNLLRFSCFFVDNDMTIAVSLSSLPDYRFRLWLSLALYPLVIVVVLLDLNLSHSIARTSRSTKLRSSFVLLC